MILSPAVWMVVPAEILCRARVGSERRESTGR